jgi:hypothetical protein
MDQPFRRFYCDVCGKPIDDLKRGYVIWKTDGPDHREHSFKIIHQKVCDQKDYGASMPLMDYLGPDGLSRLLAFLSYGPLAQTSEKEKGPADMDEFVDLVRRLQIPHYEEARRKFSDEKVQHYHQGNNQVAPYLGDSLRHTITDL